jgi:hypothetical protein
VLIHHPAGSMTLSVAGMASGQTATYDIPLMSVRRLNSGSDRPSLCTKADMEDRARGEASWGNSGRRSKFTGEPAQRPRGHGVARYDGSTGATALLALEGLAGRAAGLRPEPRQQHALLRAVRAVRSLDRGDLCSRYRFEFGHDASRWFGFSRQKQTVKSKRTMLLSACEAVFKFVQIQKLRPRRVNEPGRRS